jgi:hypothetical protein
MDGYNIMANSIYPSFRILHYLLYFPSALLLSSIAVKGCSTQSVHTVANVSQTQQSRGQTTHTSPSKNQQAAQLENIFITIKHVTATFKCHSIIE